jgi:hypothetical protein
MAEPRPEAAFAGPVIMQIFVQRSRYGVLDSRFYGVRCETSTHPLSESGCSATPLLRLMANM